MGVLTILSICSGGRQTIQVLAECSATRRLLTELAQNFLQARLRDAETTLRFVVAAGVLHRRRKLDRLCVIEFKPTTFAVLLLLLF